MKPTRTKVNFCALALGALLLSGCSTMDRLFGDAPAPPLTGERISVLQLQRDLVPDAEAASTEAYLPDAWDNKFWPQSGGYPSHAMGHVALGGDLKKAWDTSIGKGGSNRRPLIDQLFVVKRTNDGDGGFLCHVRLAS